MIIHPALLFLIKTQSKGKNRQALRSLKTWRGKLYSLVAVAIIASWLVPQIVRGFSANTSEAAAPYINAFMPFGLLFLCLISLVTEMIETGSKTISFTLAETEFLFPGPFKRWELLIYKIRNSTQKIFLLSLLISIFAMRLTPIWLACFMGIFFTLLFIHLFSMAMALLRLTLLERAYTLSRKSVLIALGFLLVLGLWKGIDWPFALEQIHAGEPLVLTEAVRNTWIGSIILAPFDVFVRTIMAKSFFPDLLLWASAAAGINLFFLITVIGLDANYLETALSVSEKTYAEQQRMKRGGDAAIGSTKKTAEWSLPSFPWLWGTGPILWRQSITAIRSAAGFLIFLFCLGIGITIAQGESDEKIPFVLALTLAISLLCTHKFPFDFRGDLDRMDWLKMIPAGSIPISIGQVLTPVLIVSLLEELLLLGGLMSGLYQNWKLILIGMALVPSFNLLIYGLENLIFLLFPKRMDNTSSGDFYEFGRAIVVYFLKFFIIGGAVASLIGIGYGGYYLLGKHIAVFIAIAWTLLTVAGLALLPYIAWAYEKFDPSVDTPV